MLYRKEIDGLRALAVLSVFMLALQLLAVDTLALIFFS